MLYWLTISIFGLTFLQTPSASGELLWDSANAFGFFAYAILLYLFIDTGTGRRQKIHKWLSYLGLAAVLLHIAVLWIPDTTIWNYLSFEAPHFMLAALIALLLLILITLISIPSKRRYWHGDHRTFQTFHEWFGIAFLAAALWHMIGSGFYLSTVESILLIAISLSVWIGKRTKRFPNATSTMATSVGALLVPVGSVLLKAIL